MEYSLVMEYLLKMCMKPQVQFPALKIEEKKEEGKEARKKTSLSTESSTVQQLFMRTDVSHYCVIQSAGH